MRLQGVLIIIVLFWGALIGLLLWLDNRREQLLRLRVKKLYASKLYAAMWPRIKSCKNRTIEKLTVDRNGFSITFMQPAGEMARYASITSVAFDMKKEGYAPLTETQQQALLVLIEESLPKLTIKKKYALVQKRAPVKRGLDGQAQLCHKERLQKHARQSAVLRRYAAKGIYGKKRLDLIV